MKRLFSTIFFLCATAAASAQLYHPGEVLNYRVSYRAKMFPNTEMGSVDVKTSRATLDGKTHYKVEGLARTLPTYRWFFNLEDTYTVWIDTEKLRPVLFTGDIHEGDYTFETRFEYDWDAQQVNTRWRRGQKPYKEKTMDITAESMDAISLFFSLRTTKAEDFTAGKSATLKMVLQDTIRHINYRYIGKEVKKIRNMGKYNALKFECQLGTSEGFSFTDGTVFTLWISDDRNKIPLAIESPVKVGSINVYISGYKGLKYPVTSLIN